MIPRVDFPCFWPKNKNKECFGNGMAQAFQPWPYFFEFQTFRHSKHQGGRGVRTRGLRDEQHLQRWVMKNISFTLTLPHFYQIWILINKSLLPGLWQGPWAKRWLKPGLEPRTQGLFFHIFHHTVKSGGVSETSSKCKFNHGLELWKFSIFFKFSKKLRIRYWRIKRS